MIADIENGIINRIRAAMAAGVLGYTLRKVDTYAGEFSDGIERIVRDFPAVLVAFNGAPLIQEARASYTFRATFSLIICATSLRNEKSSRHGSGGAVGSYQIITDMIELLSGQKFGLEITPLVPRGVRPLMNDKADTQLASIYGLDFDTVFTMAPEVAGSSLADFATFHADWDVPPHGNVVPPLPAEAADASDTITLPTA